MDKLAGWEKIQAKTFTKWINAQLKGAGEVNDILVDLQDGKNLAKLLKTISGEDVGKLNATPKMKIQKVENCNTCLKFIADHDVKLVGIGAEEIVDGNPKLTLGLIWTLILRFVIVGLSEEGLSAKQGLLLWCQKKTQPYNNVKIEDFTFSWKDGLGLNALIHRHRPDLIDYDKLTKDNPLQNWNEAMDIAEKHLGVPKILDAEDVVDTAKPDERSIMTYIALLYNVFSSMDQAEVAGRRVANFLNFKQQISSMCHDYEERTRAVQAECKQKAEEFSSAADTHSYKECKSSLNDFQNFRKTRRRAIIQEADDLAALFTNIQTKLRFQKLPAYHPGHGLLPPDTEAVVEHLEKAAANRRTQLNENMRSIKQNLETNFANLANAFNQKTLHVKQSALQDFGDDLQGAIGHLDSLIVQLREHRGQLGPIEAADKLCEEASIETNEHTDLTVDDLTFEIDTVTKLINKTKTSVEAQIAAQGGSGISAEQMEEYKKTFYHFDEDCDGTLNRLEFKSCLSALGLIDISFEGGDAKFEAIFTKVSGGKSDIPFPSFVEYMEAKAKSTMDADQLTESFKVLAGGKDFLTTQDCQVGGLKPEEIEYVTLTLPQKDGGYDYNAFVSSSFK